MNCRFRYCWIKSMGSTRHLKVWCRQKEVKELLNKSTSLTAELQTEINNLSGTVNDRTGNYNQVITEFNTLVDSYNDLLAQFTELQADYNELGTNYKDLGDQWKKSQEDIQKLQDIQSMTIEEAITEIKTLEQSLLEKVGGERRAVLVKAFDESYHQSGFNYPPCLLRFTLILW